MGTQLSIFDYLPSSESQVDEIPVIKNNLVAFPAKKVEPSVDPVEEEPAPHPLKTELNLLTAWLPIVHVSNEWKKELEAARIKLEKNRFELNRAAAQAKDPWGDPVELPRHFYLFDFLEEAQMLYDDALAGHDRHWATQAEVFISMRCPGRTMSTDEAHIEARIEYLQSRLDATEPKPEPIPLTKAGELIASTVRGFGLAAKDATFVADVLAKALAEYNATPDSVLKERLGVLPKPAPKKKRARKVEPWTSSPELVDKRIEIWKESLASAQAEQKPNQAYITLCEEMLESLYAEKNMSNSPVVAAPKHAPVQLTPVRWSVARGETHLRAPGAKSPICGAPDGREGVYTATGEPYSWQTCVRGLTPMCAACERLEKGN